jgi:hypothetical protein
MRLALLGPAEGQPGPLESAVRFVLSIEGVDRALYLGIDGALDAIVRKLATHLVGDNPSADAVWSRSARACLRATASQIDEYIVAERARSRLRLFESLPDAETRAVEMLGGTLAVMIYDKERLDEEDLLPARILSFGKSRTPVVKQVGKRWFLSPGTLAEGGIMLLEDTDNGILLTLLDPDGRTLRRETLATPSTAKVRVSGAPG